MGRYVGPVCRQCRREGMKLFLKASRCTMAKCPIERERPAPGMHGQFRGRKVSDYGVQLREKQRLRRQYGMQEAQFRVFFTKAARKRGVTGETLLQMLEARLDNVLFRLGLAPNRRAARQIVSHGHVLVNGRRAGVPSMLLRPEAVIQVKSRTRSKEMVQRNLEQTESRPVPAWLECDRKAGHGKMLRLPTRDEIAPLVNEQLVVELYSK